jgi:hypothetical protein
MSYKLPDHLIAIRAECIRLRVEEDLSVPELMQRTGAKKGFAYNSVKGIKKKKRVHHNAAWWSDEEIAFLRKFYRKGKILTNLPKRSWVNIVQKADKLGLRRDYHQIYDRHRPAKEPHYLVMLLKEYRLERKIPLIVLERKTKILQRLYREWEAGRLIPNIAELEKWATALGFKLFMKFDSTTIAPVVKDKDKPFTSLFDPAKSRELVEV